VHRPTLYTDQGAFARPEFVPTSVAASGVYQISPFFFDHQTVERFP
jgi:hypothetical protein